MLSALLAFGLASAAATAQDPCVAVGDKKWVKPADLRACYQSFPVDDAEKSNIIEVVNKTLAFHASSNYQLQAPPPYDKDVHSDIFKDVARISGQSYDSDYDLHLDLSGSVKRLFDGHCAWVNYCYDGTFMNVLPLPLVLVNGEDVHIAAEAYDVASAEYADQLSEWEDAITGQVEGGLKALNGARVIEINGGDPFEAVNENAKTIGGYQALGTRQIGFFSSYQRSPTNWTYVPGNFAIQNLPVSDSVTLLVQLQGSKEPQSVTIPYFSRISPDAVAFTDGASFRENNCKATNGTNGASYYDEDASEAQSFGKPVTKAMQTHGSPSRKYTVNILMDASPVQNILLPPALAPRDPIESHADSEAYMLEDGITGVLALGSFVGPDQNYTALVTGIYDGLMALKSSGAERLIVDVTNNGGGYVCAGHALHRFLSGPKDTTVPNAGLNSTVRAGPLATKVAQAIADSPDVDPDLMLYFNPLFWRNGEDVPFDSNDNWLDPSIEKIINGRVDAFSETLGNECPEDQAFPEGAQPPDSALFEGSKVIIASNGRCASTCAIFSVAMVKEEGATAVVVGGKEDTPQQYCGVVGGQTLDFSTIDSEIKTVGLKDSKLAPPDLIVNGVQGITWRLGYGIDNPSEPEEWQDRPATHNLPLTLEIANHPQELWKKIAELF